MNLSATISLVTGAAGLLGSWLVEHLLEKGHVVHACVKTPPARLCCDSDRLFTRLLDVCDSDAVAACAREVQPDLIFHLAAQSLPGLSWQRPAFTLDVNIRGGINLLDACRNHAKTATFVVMGSSSEYAARASAGKISENAPLLPASPYALSKWCFDRCACLYAKRYGVRIVRARPFFIIGPRKTGDVCSDFARGIVAVERGRAPCLSVGNLDVVRDFLDARDGVRALALIAEKGISGEVYNICSGQGRSVREVLDCFCGMAKRQIETRVDASLLRPTDELTRVGDPARISALGWRPETPWQKTISDILNYWRSRE